LSQLTLQLGDLGGIYAIAINTRESSMGFRVEIEPAAGSAASLLDRLQRNAQAWCDSFTKQKLSARAYRDTDMVIVDVLGQQDVDGSLLNGLAGFLGRPVAQSAAAAETNYGDPALI
jgi:hypothetical protein